MIMKPLPGLTTCRLPGPSPLNRFKLVHLGLPGPVGKRAVGPLLKGLLVKYSFVLYVALTVCTREAVKLMRETGVDDGHIINIGSMSGHRVIPGTLHFYTATKVQHFHKLYLANY